MCSLSFSQSLCMLLGLSTLFYVTEAHVTSCRVGLHHGNVLPCAQPSFCWTALAGGSRNLQGQSLSEYLFMPFGKYTCTLLLGVAEERNPEMWTSGKWMFVFSEHCCYTSVLFSPWSWVGCCDSTLSSSTLGSLSPSLCAPCFSPFWGRMQMVWIVI